MSRRQKEKTRFPGPPHGKSDKSLERFFRKLLNIAPMSNFWWSTNFDDYGFLNGEVLVIDPDKSLILIHIIKTSTNTNSYQFDPTIIRNNEPYLRANPSNLAECEFLAEIMIDAAAQMDPSARLPVYLEL